MRTEIHPELLELTTVKEADEILRKCVHCGFCTATCPTYLISGDELDGPRGRIYLIKDLLETNQLSRESRVHLDRCLTCRSCETTCPSGVEFGHLMDIGRGFAADMAPEPFKRRLYSMLLRFAVPKVRFFRFMLQLAQFSRPLLPKTVADRLPRISQWIGDRSRNDTASVLLLSGCVQSAATPGVAVALQQLLSRQGVSSEILSEGCCGALDYHLGAHEAGYRRMRRIVDRLYDRLETTDYIVSMATGCGVTIKEYPYILRHDPVYAKRSALVVEKLVDAVELFTSLPVSLTGRVAVHTPCTMQHGLKLQGAVEALLKSGGAEVVPHRDGHLCCGSAGTYSILEPDRSRQLRDKKIKDLVANRPDVIVTANIGCQIQLDGASEVPVTHWLEYVASQLSD